MHRLAMIGKPGRRSSRLPILSKKSVEAVGGRLARDVLQPGNDVAVRAGSVERRRHGGSNAQNVLNSDLDPSFLEDRASDRVVNDRPVGSIS